MNPLVSVFIPTFNRKTLLTRAVNSVLEQSYQNVEILVVDDGSTDGTIEYMESLQIEHKNIVFIKNESNSGACVSRNKAIEVASGEFILGLDDDDYFEIDRISDFVELWPRRKLGVVGLFSNRVKKISENHKVELTSPEIVTRDMLMLANYIGPQLFLETKIAKLVGGFDVDFPAWQDLDFCLRVLEYGDAQCVYNKSYIVDASHPHERISNKKIEKISQAYNLIVEKNQLSKKQACRLKLQLLRYNYEHKAAGNLLLLYFSLLDIRAILRVVQLVIRQLFPKR